MRIYLECTLTYRQGGGTGIQRVVRRVIAHAHALGPRFGAECIPVVFLNGRLKSLAGPDDLWRRPPVPIRQRLNNLYFRTARLVSRVLPHPGLKRFLLAHRSRPGLPWLLAFPVARAVAAYRRLWPRDPAPEEAPCPLEAGDILFLLDNSWPTMEWDVVTGLRQRGVRVVAMLYDAICLTHPQFFVPELVAGYRKWFDKMMESADGVLCISGFTRRMFDELANASRTARRPEASVIQLGHDIAYPSSEKPHHRRLASVLRDNAPVFACVGTLEPRKNHATLLDAFERIWARDRSIRLVLVGKEGWLCKDLVARIQEHAQRNRLLFWFDDVDDHDLALLYRKVTGLILPSVVEGFGLPLVEALACGTPALASDIEVFREIAGLHATYFPAQDADALAALILGGKFRSAHAEGPGSAPFTSPTWEECTAEVLRRLTNVSGHPGSPARGVDSGA